MLFNTIDYLVFFIFIFSINYILPCKIRYIWLLIASYYFYMHWNPWYVLLLMGTTIISYMAGLSLCKKENRKIKLGGGYFCIIHERVGFTLLAHVFQIL